MPSVYHNIKPDRLGRVLDFAGTTGLEPATYCVTGSRSNQLSYAPVFNFSLSTRGETRTRDLSVMSAVL